MKKWLLILIMLLLGGTGLLFVGSGFGKRTDVRLVGHSVSEDGSQITIQTALAGSAGYIRDIMVERHSDALYCSFHTAFGGLNSRIGAKSRFEIELDSSCTKIYFDRGGERYDLVLQKEEASGTWMPAHLPGSLLAGIKIVE